MNLQSSVQLLIRFFLEDLTRVRDRIRGILWFSIVPISLHF